MNFNLSWQQAHNTAWHVGKSKHQSTQATRWRTRRQANEIPNQKH